MPFLGALLVLAAVGATSRAATLDDSFWVIVNDLARSGRFEDVLAHLRQGGEPLENLGASSLVRDLELQQQNELHRREEQHNALEQKLQEMETELREGKLHEALAAALEAQDLADVPESMLADDRVTDLIRQAEDATDAAKQIGAWVEVTGVYRALDILHEKSAVSYRDKLKNAVQHVRALRLYAPQRVHELIADRARHEGREDEIEPYLPENTTWQQRVKGAKRTLLRKVLEYAVDRHVDAPTYRTLLAGAIDQLLTLAGNDDILVRVAQDNDPRTVASFRRFLVGQRAELEQGGGPMTERGLKNFITRVYAMNRTSVKLPAEVLYYEMTEGATAELDDFTTVIWPFEKPNFIRNTKGNFTGVGIQISLKEKRLIVVSPLPGTPAYRARILPGDIIAAVDGVSTEGWSLDRAVRQITGQEGTTVTLGIERKGSPGIEQFLIKRARIDIESVRGWKLVAGGAGTWDYWIDPELGIAYVRLSQFIPQTADALDTALSDLGNERTLRALILDLRFNPGGLLKSAIDVADRFIDDGTIVSTVGATGLASRSHRAQARRTRRRVPMVVLMNKHSASASEIVAGAVKYHKISHIVGERSFGKGSVQDLFPLEDGQAYLKLTTQYYTLPDGRIIHRKPASADWGIKPDLAVRMTDKQTREAVEFRRELDVIRDVAPLNGQKDEPPVAEELITKAIDSQLEAAVLVLKTRLVADHHQRLAGRDQAASVP